MHSASLVNSLVDSIDGSWMTPEKREKTRMAFDFAIPNGYMPIWLPPDGNCFCHALNFHLFKKQKSIGEIKSLIVDRWVKMTEDGECQSILDFNSVVISVPDEVEAPDEMTGIFTRVLKPPLTLLEFQEKV
jgi:hypothetical protein